MMSRFAVLAAALLLSVLSVEAETEAWSVEVSSTGAVRTFAAAFEKLRVRRAVGQPGSEKVTVRVASGRYFICEPMSFGAQDSGTAEAPVEFVADGDVVVDGGVELPVGQVLSQVDRAAVDRVRKDRRDAVRVVDLKALGLRGLEAPKDPERSVGAILPRILGSDGQPYEYARYPKKGWCVFERALAKGEGTRGRSPEPVGYADRRISSWTDESDVFAYGYPAHDWAPARMAMRELDPTNMTMRLLGSGYGFRNGHRWFARNVLRELTTPGECVLDRRAGLLYYLPRDADADKGLTIAQATGFARFDKVGFVSFRGFRYQNFQGDVIVISGSHDLAFADGGCRNCLGFLKARDSVRVRVFGMNVGDIAENAIGLAGGSQYDLMPSGNVVERCRIRRFGTEYAGYSGAIRVSGCGAQVVGNDISETSHAAVFFGGTCHRIVGNEIYRACLESGEMGAVYTGRDWVCVGNVIEGNYFHDLPRTCRQPTRAIMLDDGAGGITIRSNRFVRCAEGICTSGIGNVIENNYFEACPEAIGLWSCWSEPNCFDLSVRNNGTRLKRLAAAPVDSPVWKERFPWAALLRDAVRDRTPRDPSTRTRIVGNTLVSYGKPQFHWCRPASPRGYLITGNVERYSTVSEPHPYFEFGKEVE